MSEGEVPGGTPLARIPSGVAGLDRLMDGGWPEGGLFVVTGPPGSGKTTLGNQFCFAQTREGRRAVYVTLLAETHGRMVAHLGGLSFFDGRQVGQTLHYVSGFAALESGGPQGLLDLIRRTVREQGATALVLDGLSAVEERTDSRLAFRQFLHALSVHASLASCTTLLLTTAQGLTADPEHGMVDGILELTTQTEGMWTVRVLELRKLRGSRAIGGRHLFEITDAGLRVYPRFESVHTEMPRVLPDPDERLAFGVPRLDEMLDGGLIGKSSTLLFGSPGAGKTLLGLHFLHAGAQRGERGLHVSFSENAERLVQKGRLVGLDLGPAVADGRVRIEARAPVEVLPDKLAEELLELVDAQRATRLFLDGLEPLAQQPFDERRQLRFLGALLNALRERRVTVIATQQTNTMFGGELHPPLKNVEALLDNVIFLRFFELRSQLYRLLSILKMRESDNDPALREFTITARGVDVAATFESAEAILTGLARPVTGASLKRKAPAEAAGKARGLKKGRERLGALLGRGRGKKP